VTSAQEELAADAVKQRRLAAGLTQEELAERAGISARTVSDIERGLRSTVYPDTARRLSAAFRLDDEERREFESVLRGRERGDDGPQATALPLAPTSLLGRSSELNGVTTAMAASGVRLLTLTGPGGIGKTRLAIEAARRLEGSFSDGVFFVPLGDTHDAALVAPAVAKALGVVETGESLELLIERRLAGRRALMLLDTYEHLLEAAPFVASLLQRAPDSKFLVTSRSPLHVRGEFEFPVPPLEMPHALGDVPLEEVRVWPATELFIERALAVDPHLKLDASGARFVVDICRKLDGVPLAIELAAARAKHLPLPALAEQLTRRLPVLTGGALDLPVRQRTMRASVAWSYDLLPPEGRVLFRRLAVFSGGFDLGSVEPVCGSAREVGDPLEAVGILVDNSLIAVSHSAEARYDILDVIAEYAVERLAEAGEIETMTRRHALHFLRLAEEAEPNLVRAQQADWLERLELERGNLRRAIAWSIEHAEKTAALRFTVALWRYWRYAGEFAEGRRWSEATLAMAGVAPPSLLAKALWGTAFLAYPQGDYRRMAEIATRDLEVARESDDPMDLRNALTVVGQVAMCEGRYADALGPFRDSLRICEQLGASWQLGTSHLNFGNSLLHSGQLDEAERIFESGRRVYREIGDETFAARITIALAHCALARGDAERAGGLARQALAAFVKQRERIGVAEAFDALAAVAAARSDHERAAKLDGAAKRMHKTIASRPAPFEQAITRRLIEAGQRSFGAERWQKAWDHGQALGAQAAVDYAMS
jgi:predicted ATPase/transcriptional regulator with XRE-family HTH domain